MSAGHFLHQCAHWCRPFESLGPAKIKRAAEAALLILVGVSGFEPEASWTRTKRDTKLRHTPLARHIIKNNPTVVKSCADFQVVILLGSARKIYGGGI